MKNLKKVLSLALVFAMVLGLCIGAMAANTQDVTTLSDWGNVTHKEAAQLLNAFNIMQGYPDKTYRPTNTVTRAEAVKMIDVGLWGGVDQPDRFVGSEVAFSDVKSGDWYAGHVVYAETLGILDGFPDGTFRPNDTVTGYQMLKMALIALNYSSEVEGLTGAGWDIRTMRLATDPSAGNGASLTNLTAGLSEITDWNAPLTRDQAAQIIYNMIMHSYISYNLNANGQVGNIKTYGATFGATFLGLTEESGTLIANAYGNLSAERYNAAGQPVDAQGTVITNTADIARFTVNDKRLPYNAAVKVPVYTTNETTGVRSLTTYKNVPVIIDSTLADIGSPVTIFYKNGGFIGAALDGWTEVEAEWNANHSTITNYEGENTAATIPTYTHGSMTNDYVVTKYYDTDGNGLIDVVTNTCYGNAKEVKEVVSTKNCGNVYQVTDIQWRSSYDTTETPSESVRNNFVFESESNFTAKKGDVIAYTTQPTVFKEKSATYGIVLDSVAGTVSRVVDNAATYTHTVTIDGVAYPLVNSLKVNGAPNGNGTIAYGTAGTFFLYPNDQVGYVKTTEAPAAHYALIYDADYSRVTSSYGIHTDTQGIAIQVCAILDDGTSGVYNVNGIWQNVGAKAKDSTNPSQLVPTKTLVKASTFNATTIAADADDTTHATIKVDANADGVAETDVGLDGFFAANGVNTAGSGNVLYDVKGFDANKLVTYTVNDDGSLNIEFVDGTTMSSKTTVNSGNPAYDKYYFTGKSLTFVQTKKATPTQAETWTLAVGLPSNSYTIAQNQATVYTKSLFTTDNSIVALVIANGAQTDITPKTEFVYVISDNGVIGWNNDAAVHEVSLYSSVTNTIETVKVNGAVSPNTFYSSYNSTDSTLGTQIIITTKAGFITSFADNVVGLTRVVDGSDHVTGNMKTATTAYVVGKDTRYYLIDGTKTTEISASEVGTQGVMDWTKATAADESVKYTEYYQAAVMTTTETGNVASNVIIFGAEQAFTGNAATRVPTGR